MPLTFDDDKIALVDISGSHIAIREGDNILGRSGFVLIGKITDTGAAQSLAVTNQGELLRPSGSASEKTMESLKRSFATEFRTKKKFDVEKSQTGLIFRGVAPVGTGTDETGWTIKKTTLDANGDPESEEWTQEGVATWDNRLNETYN